MLYSDFFECMNIIKPLFTFFIKPDLVFFRLHSSLYCYFLFSLTCFPSLFILVHHHHSHRLVAHPCATLTKSK